MSHANRADGLDFEAFRGLAVDPTLSRHRKVGFPDEVREGREPAIFADVRGKLAGLGRAGCDVLEIGPGCGALPRLLADHCAAQGGRLTLVDSAEMLALLPDAPHVEKLAGAFPDDVEARLPAMAARFDAVLAYSVVQYVFAAGGLFRFLDRCLALLAEGGELLLGDIPNTTMRKRFFASAAGIACHRAYTGRDEEPPVRFNVAEPDQIDDGIVLAVLVRARAHGFHAWVLPQAAALPMASRREDVLIRRP
jgi:2-polyprenyl-3-methyl-5-hydroxy-6-metoxy-1,4-benzoquinol methylase